MPVMGCVWQEEVFMKKQTLLERTAAQVRMGQTEEFENFYILTVQDVFQAACEAQGHEKAGDLVIITYAELFGQRETIPESEEAIRNYLRELVFHHAGMAPESESEPGSDPEKISENMAAELWMTVEEKAGISKDEAVEEKEESSPGEYVKSFVRVTLMFVVLGIAAFILYRGVIQFIDEHNRVQDTVSEGTESEGIYKAGENGTSDGKAPDSENKTENMDGKEDQAVSFRLEGDRLLVDSEEGGMETGELFLGRQRLIFEDGELTGIERNRQTEASQNIFYDGETKYTVRDGDIYRKIPGQKEECVIRNGHVEWADFRFQSLYYVCSYQIPNSEQIKRTAYMADRDGENQSELFTDSAVLDNDGLQFTEDWVYYRKGNSVFRTGMREARKERMVKTQGEYFAFGDTLFYMDENGLNCVSEGETDYAEGEILLPALEDGQIVFVYEDGEPAQPDENGELHIGDMVYTMDGNAVTAVRPAQQIYGDELYYLYGSGMDRKIYKKAIDSDSTALVAQNGIYTDSFCIIGSWLYYSACMENIDGVQYSQTYRANLDTMAQEKVGRLFQGVITSMYPDREENRIFGEYISETVDGKIHGNICAIMEDGQMGIIEDSIPRNSGNDRLSFVAAQGDDIYCFYHECTYDSTSGVIRDISTEASLVKW